MLKGGSIRHQDLLFLCYEDAIKFLFYSCSNHYNSWLIKRMGTVQTTFADAKPASFPLVGNLSLHRRLLRETKKDSGRAGMTTVKAE